MPTNTIKPGMWAPGLNRQDPLARGLVGYWPMWEGAGSQVQDIVDTSGRLAGTINGATWIDSSRGRALDFGSSKTVSIPDTPALGGDLSITFWVEPSSTSANQYISDFSGGNEFACILGYQNGYYNVFGGTYPISVDPVRSQIPASGAGIWDFVCWTKTGNILRGYVNGRLEKSGTITAGDMVPSAGVTLGRNTANPFTGALSSYTLYDRALSSNEIKQLYNNPYRLITPFRRRFNISGFTPYPHPILPSMTGGMVV